MRVESGRARKYTVSEARSHFGDVVNTVVYTREPVIVTRHGGDAVAVVPYDLLCIVTRLEALYDLEKASRALDEFEVNGGCTLSELKKELDID